MARRRPGLAPADNLPEDVRSVLEPALDTLGRVTGTKLPALKSLRKDATLDDVIAAFNALLYRIQEE